MILDIPTKEDFYITADHMVQEAWEKVANLAYDYTYYSDACETSKEEEDNFYKYWDFARPKLISAFILVIQSVEFRLKGLIAEISPYLLIANTAKNLPKLDKNGDMSFSQFHTIDAQDLIRVYETFSDKKLSNSFAPWFQEIRSLRNMFMHTVDKKSDISPELIFKSIVTAHKELNLNGLHWIQHRYRYKSAHSDGGYKLIDGEPGEIFEMLQTHYELAGAISSCSSEMVKDCFDFDKERESFFCKNCISVMVKSEFFDTKYIDYCVGTVQYKRKKNKYLCIFCLDEQEDRTVDIWEDLDF
ncbi:hypothetical protein ACH8I4_16565 [Acinetobacter sp. ABJ_C3_5]|uniref:hypothetical protein n=1 Tax=Acinetobacter courvalinii TaxID=280147 RepID=UPI0037C5C8AB